MFKLNDKIYLVVQEDEKYYIETGVIVNNNINSENEVYVYLKKFSESFFINIDLLSHTEYDAIETFKKYKIKEVEDICKSLETRKMKLIKLNKL